MQRYFCNEKENDVFTLSKDDSYHIIKVMRMHLDEMVEVVFEEEVYLCKIIACNDIVKVLISEHLEQNNELPIKITICQSLVNEQKMDLILQKGVELGAYAFIPYQARLSVVKEKGNSDKKLIRWQRIIKEASEQSKRNIIPKIRPIMTINDLIGQNYDVKLLCSVNEVTKSMKKVIQEHIKCDTMIIVIGPEGGFTEDEEAKLVANGYIRVSLGNRVLRTETASLVALSCVNYELMR